jgi:hypothetical protein
VVFPVAESSRSKAAGAHLIHLSGTAQHRDWEIQAAFNSRIVSIDSKQDYLQSTVGLVRHLQLPSQQQYDLMLALQNLQYGGQTEQSLIRGGLYLPHQMKHQCQLNQGAEWERRTYPLNGTLNGNYFGWAGEYSCRDKMDWKIMARGGIDREDFNRAGGDQQRIELREQLTGLVANNEWLIQLEHSWLKDTQGYSAVLDYNAPRLIVRHNLRLQLRHPFNRKVDLTFNAETYQQMANLELFAMKGNSAWLGIHYTLE